MNGVGAGGRLRGYLGKEPSQQKEGQSTKPLKQEQARQSGRKARGLVSLEQREVREGELEQASQTMLSGHSKHARTPFHPSLLRQASPEEGTLHALPALTIDHRLH